MVAEEREHLAWAAVLFGGSLALYLLTLSGQPTGDSLEFAASVEYFPLGRIVEAHQLIVHPLAWGWYWAWRLLGWSGGAMLPLQVLNALAGAVCVLLVYLIGGALLRPSPGGPAERERPESSHPDRPAVGTVGRSDPSRAGSGPVALLVAVGFAVSYGTWSLSTQAEFVTPPLAISLTLLLLILRELDRERSSASRRVLLGVAVGLGALAYQTNVFLIAAGALGYLAQSRGVIRKRAMRAGQLVASAVLSAGLVYLLSLYSLFGVRSWQALAAWQPRADPSGQYYGFGLRDVAHGAYAFVRTLVGFPGIGLNYSTAEFLVAAGATKRLVFSSHYLLWALAVVGLLIIAVRLRRELFERSRSAIALIATWGLLSAAFAIYWVPGDVSFWLPVLSSWTLLAGVALGAGIESRGAPTAAASGGRLTVPVFAALVTVLALSICNAASILPLSRAVGG